MKSYCIITAVVFFGLSREAIGQAGLSASESANLSRVYEFNVVLKNDSTLKTRSKIFFDANGRNYLSAKMLPDENIFPDETKYVYKKNINGPSLKGIAVDSCWLFMSDQGKINSYSNIPESGIRFIVAIQKGTTGAILPLNKGNVMIMVADNPKALALAEENDLISAIVQYNQSM